MAQPSPSSPPRTRLPTHYPYLLPYQTRWLDNDTYAHMNNSVYYHLFDSIVNTYLALHCSHSPTLSSQIGLVVHTSCDYFASLQFPELATVGLRVVKLGGSSAEFEIGIFGVKEGGKGELEVKAVGRFVHVYVEREGRRPGKNGMSEEIRAGLSKLESAAREGIRIEGGGSKL